MKRVEVGEEMSFLLSLLGILVDRAGGSMVVGNLSEYKGFSVRVNMCVDIEGDKVTVVSKKEPIGEEVPHP